MNASTYFEVRSSSKPDGCGEVLEPYHYAIREDAEAAARRESAMGFFSQLWECDRAGMKRHLCEYAAYEVTA